MTKTKNINKETTNDGEQQAFIDLYGKHKKVLDIYQSISGWVWYVTKMPKTTNIWEGLVQGFETEFGSFYKSDLINNSYVYRVPKSQWHEFDEVFFK